MGTVPDLTAHALIDPQDAQHAEWLKNLQGNILSGHGRDHTINIFLRLSDDERTARALVSDLAALVTSAHMQERERQEFKKWRISGGLFGNLFISMTGYAKLGFPDKTPWRAFDQPDSARNTQSNFADGMAAHAVHDFGDPPVSAWDEGFRGGDIDVLLLLADDDPQMLERAASNVLDTAADRSTILHIERGTALRTPEGEGIEHFGYVDGRSQPHYLTSDFDTDATGTEIDGAGDGTDIWDPKEPLGRVLVHDPLQAGADDCFGSFLVFRKLEQNVRGFVEQEQTLAAALRLSGDDGERAGAMVVGRFRNGTPLVQTSSRAPIPGSPAKANNFVYATDDADGLKCPFQAHIRKTNPRRTDAEHNDSDRARRITRRGIPYGSATVTPSLGQPTADLPTGGVGLLFMCFQESIRKQFAFMQRVWANNQNFQVASTGIDPIIGQIDKDRPRPTVPPAPPADPEAVTDVARIDQGWHSTWNGPATAARTPAFFGDFVRMKGGEFFFAPSIPFLRGL